MRAKRLSWLLKRFICLSMVTIMFGLFYRLISGNSIFISLGLHLLLITPSAGLILIAVLSSMEGRRGEFLLSLGLILFLLFNFFWAYFF